MNDVADVVQGLDLRSLAIGFAGGLFGALGIVLAMKVGKLVLKLAIIAAVMALLGGGYLGLK